MKIEIKEFNFKGYTINKTVTNKSDEDVYTYTMQNAPALKSEERCTRSHLCYASPADHEVNMRNRREKGDHLISIHWPISTDGITNW